MSSYQVLTFTYSVGDPEVTQNNDGSGNAIFSITPSLIPPYGFTILNVAAVNFLPGNNGAPSQSVTPLSNDRITPWMVNYSSDSFLSYPAANGTPILQVIAIAGD